MKILCIEDLQDKFEHINGVLREMGEEMVWKTNCQDGVVELSRNEYSHLLLDMSMPICEDNRIKNDNFDAFAGMAILREIKRKKYNTRVIIVTGFDDFEYGNEIITLDELVKKIQEKYQNNFVGFLRYDSATAEWQERLKEYLGLEKKNENSNN